MVYMTQATTLGDFGLNPLKWPKRYANWLHLQWPGGTVEKLPVADEHGRTNVDGLYIVGDLTGVPLLKLSANAGHDAVCRIADELEGEEKQDGVLDVAIIGGGTAGFSAALAAEEKGLRYCVFEASTPFNTIKDFPKGKPIYTYPTNVEVKGFDLHDKSKVKEGLVEDLEEQTVDKGLTWVKGRVEKISRRGQLLEVKLAGQTSNREETKRQRDEETKAPKAEHSVSSSLDLSVSSPISAKRVIVAIGRSGNYRKLGIPGEDKADKVTHRLHDPKDYCGKKILVVGGGDSAMETAISLADCGADVTLSYRKAGFSRPKPENQEKIQRFVRRSPSSSPAAASDGVLSYESPTSGDDDEINISASDHRQGTGHGPWNRDPDHASEGRITLLMPSNVTEIKDDRVDIKLDDGSTKTVENDQVFLMIGREAPLDFFRRSGVKIRNERTTWWWGTLIAFLIFCVWLYHWKGAGGPGKALLGIDGFYMPSWLLIDTQGLVAGLQERLGGYFADTSTLGGTILASMQNRSFYYTFLYCACVVIFGIDRMRRRKTPYVKVQTVTLMLIQCIPLFILPEILLPYGGRNGWFDSGLGLWLADTLFPNESWWRAYGLILAWPLLVWNWFTSEPIWGWIVLGVLQTFVIIPAIIYYWGKGAYCGWICSCGALAETLGDRHREKMPHGIWPNRFNFIGQVLLLVAVGIQALFILRWLGVEWAVFASDYLAGGIAFISWAYFVDLLWAGIIGVGFYFWLSGRVWCRFACPLAALMHVYHRFSRFAILPEKKKCISCNVCTSVCHQGIDVMSFANKGRPMIDPQCVRCSACVQMCPTGVLEFGMIDRQGNPTGRDPGWLAASPVRIREGSLGGGVEHADASPRGPAPVLTRAKLTVNGKRPRKSGPSTAVRSLFALRRTARPA
jgi:thioredoxin reductase/ferredoxin